MGKLTKVKLELTYNEIDACAEELDYNAQDGDFNNKLSKKLLRIKQEHKISKKRS